MSMTKEEVLAKYFSEKKGFRDVQEETIDSLLAGKNTLCLISYLKQWSSIIRKLVVEAEIINRHMVISYTQINPSVEEGCF